jgi:hypothetical protein
VTIVTNLARDVVTDVYLFVVQQHAIDMSDGGIGKLSSLIMHKAIALRTTLLVSGDLARQDFTEGSKCVMKSLR